MNEVTVVENDGETAVFSDGTRLLRQRPENTMNNPNRRLKAVYKRNLQVQPFKRGFRIGFTEDHIVERLNDPNLKLMDDGEIRSVVAPPPVFESKKGDSRPSPAGTVTVKDGVFTANITAKIPDGTYSVFKWTKLVSEEIIVLEIRLV
jgi:hypothetical protein